VQSGVKSLELLKTTQSGFENFHRDRFTSLPDVSDRLLGTSAEAEWVYPTLSVSVSLNAHNKRAGAVGSVDYGKVNEEVLKALIVTFAGPADTGVYSPSVQQTLYLMGVAALTSSRGLTPLEKITLQMPNIHNLPFPLELYKLANKDHTGSVHIFYPIDEPHGMIKAVIEQNKQPQSRYSLRSRI
jgi:urate oxidase